MALPAGTRSLTYLTKDILIDGLLPVYMNINKEKINTVSDADGSLPLSDLEKGEAPVPSPDPERDAGQTGPVR